MENQKKSLSPEEDALVHIHACTDKYFLEDRFIDSFKGRGVFTLRTIKPSSFVVEYRGNIFSHKDTRLKRKRDDKLSSFLYKYLWNGEKWCIDASKEDGSLGRLVNDDDTSPNCEMRKVVFEGEPHLCLFALRQIAIGEEITYNYGDSPYLWRSKASHFRSSTSWNEGPEGSCVDDELPDPGPSQRHKLRDRPFNYSQETTGSLNEEETDKFSSDADDGSTDEDFVPSENEDESEKLTVGQKNFCFVCGKGVIKVIRHLARHAEEEPEIAKVLALPKGSKEQKLALAKLRNQGNFIHNQKVVRNNSGRLKIGRRLNRKVNLDKYAPCLHCKGLFNAAKLWCHVVKCAFRKSSNTGTASKLTASSESTLWRMLVGMTQDGIALVIQNDNLLVDLAQYLIQKYGTCKERQVYVQQKLRDMGRLLLALHDKSVFRYEDAIKPKNFYKVVKTVEILAGFDNEKKSYSKPSLAVNLVRSLMNICGIVLSANDDNEKMVASAKKFMALCKKEWTELLPQRASEQKGDSPSTIPFTHDVQALYRHLESASASAIASLKVLDMPQVYNSLCRVTLAQVSVLNKRAPEVSSMTLKSFQEREDTDQVLSKNFIRINIHSKTNQNVAVLLTSGLVSAITLLVDKRSTCGVHMDNPFLFAKPDNSVSSLYSDRECVRTFLQLCNAKKPQHLKLASLQKHVARIFQILNLENDELDHLAKLLGHDIRTDRGYYRLPKGAVELAKIAKLLLAMEKGSLERYKGNSLDEIEIQDELESDLELAEPNESLEENTEELDVSQQQEDDMEEQDSEMMDTLQMDLNAPTSSSEDEWVEASVEEVSSRSGSCYDDFSDEQASFTSENQCIQNDLETPLLESPTESNSVLPIHCDSSVQQENEANYNSDDWSDGEPKTLSNSRKNFCYICGKAQSKISRHLKTHRKDVPEIAEVFALRRKSKERKKQIAVLRNKGNFKHNQEVLKNRSGELKVRQSKGKAISAETFATCLYCKVMYCRKTIWLHYKKCASKKALKATNVVSTSILISVPTMTTDPKKLPADVRNILKTMKKDEITAAVWSDPCVLQLAQCFCNSTKPSVSHIRQMVRLTGRLLLEFRKKSISSFDDAIKPDNFSKVHEAVKEMIGWETGKPKSLPKFRSLLKKVGEIKYAMALWEEAEAEKVQNADAFIKMVTEEWCQRIREKSIVNSVPTRPFIQDVQLLYQYMEKTMGSALQTLQMYESSPVYNSLLKVSFAQLLILNRNVRKVSRVTLKSFVERSENEPQMEAAEGHSQLEQVLCKRFVKINVISKCGPKDGEKKVTVKMTPELLNAITLLVSKRENCGVSQRTPFLFAKTGAIMISVFHGQSSFNNAVDWCQAKNPKSLKSKGFRKQIERIFLIMCLSNEDLELLAKKLGRDIPTDKEYYQTPEAANDIAKISELLLAMENGCLDEYEGKSFEDIVLADELQPDLEQDESEKSDASEEEDAESSFEQSAEQTNKNNSDVNSEDEDRSEDVPVKGDEKQLSPSNRDSRNMYSCEDEDMNVDFDVDLDTDEEREKHGDPSRSPAVSETSSANETAKRGKQKRGRKKKENSTNNHYADSDQEETRDIDSEEYLEEEEEQADSMDVDSSRSFATIDAEKRNKLLAKMMKEVKIVLPKLDIDKFKPSVPISELLSLCETSSVTSEPVQNDDKQCETSTRSADVMASAPISQLSHCETSPVNSKPVQNEDNSHRRSTRSAVVNNKPNIEKLSSTCETSPVNSEPVQNDDKLPQTSTRSAVNNKPNIEKTMNATCSRCKKSIMKGQTAFQKKGFSDVFCSKGCLFEMFPINKPGSKICHHCNKEITQLLELVIAIVDTKGTTKDFCNVSCLCYFKSNISFHRKPQTLCRMCHKFCINTCDLILKGAVHKFCSYPCLESYRRDLCDNCSCRCYNLPLLLKLEEDTKNLCTEKCLQEFKEKTKTYICIMCHSARPIFDMVNLKNSDGTVELFCSQPCVQSYQLQPSPEVCLQENQKSAQWQTINNGNQPQGNVPSEVVTVASDSSVIKNEPCQAAVAPRLCASTPCVQCSKCGKRMQRGETLYQPQNSQAIYCSTICLSESIKTCYNCCQVISRPRDIILAPVDRTGTMKELCSNACLSSVQTKRKLTVHKPQTALSRTECKMCAKFCHCPFKARVGRLGLNLCSSACFINYHKVNNLPISICEICCSTVMKEKMVVKMEDGIKYVCSDQCFIKFKEKVDTLQLCPICQTSHQMSDMVENKNKDDILDFFCSDRCLMVFKAQLAVGSDSFSERNSASPTEDDIKDMKPLLAKVCCIKEEPMDVGYNQNPPSMSTEHIKDERGLAKEDLKLEEIVPPVQESVPPAPPITQVAVQVTCASCKKVLMDREAFFQKKDNSDIFCSTSCLFKFYKMKPVTKTCQFCLEPIRQSQEVLQAPVDIEGTLKEFCGQTCLSSFIYKKGVSIKIPIVPVGSHSQCSMCNRYCISKHEVIHQDAIHKVCSDHCYLRFCNIHSLSLCINCHSCYDIPIMLLTGGVLKKLCSADCLAQIKKKILMPQLCAMCHTSKPISDMMENKSSDDVVELFCSSSCVMASKIQTVSATGAELECDNCKKNTVPACHLAMADASFRNFCSLTCAMNYKETLSKSNQQEAQKEPSAATKLTETSDQTHDPPKLPDELLCANCQHIIKNKPKLVQEVGKVNFLCSLTCCEVFKQSNNITGKCEYCQSVRPVYDVQRVNNKDCCFCSEGCKVIFCKNRENEWGKCCPSCAYCSSLSITLVTARYGERDEDFCSEDCSSKYNKVFSCVAKCDTCGRKGELKKSLSLLGHVMHFCNLNCLLHFCRKMVQMKNAAPVSLSSASVEPPESSPVISNVISLAGYLAQYNKAKANQTKQQDKQQCTPLPETKVDSASTTVIQTKVFGHASVQTETKELKNKSLLCTPLVHNKGVSCTTATAETEAQTDNFFPKVIVLPIPVPVYVPLPMNMYSQYTPQPVALPLPLPVPMFLPEPSVNPTDEKIQQEPSKEDLDFRCKAETKQDNGSKVEDRLTAREMTQIHSEQIFEKDSFTDVSLGSSSGSHTPAAVLQTREEPQSSTSSSPVPPHFLQIFIDVHGNNNNKNTRCKIETLSKAAEEETPQKDCSKVGSIKYQKLDCQFGLDAWRRWIQWRKSQIDLDIDSSHSVTLKENILHCSAFELSNALSHFITEGKQADGEPYSPDTLFYLCLSIQQYLFDNDRVENIFSDLIYKKFSTEFIKILRDFKPPVSGSGLSGSCVEEDFLWECKQLGTYSPIVLLNTLLFFFCKFFGFTTVEQHHQLSFARLRCCSRTGPDKTKTTYLRFSPPSSTKEAESDTDEVPAKKRKKEENKQNYLEMMENLEDPLRCPVRLFQFYLSKCSDSMRNRSDVFYLLPERRCFPSSLLWFSSTRLDDGPIEAMLMRSLAVQQLREGT
ncbi:zinc finger MYM-type protein 4-like [Solea senegalensis]|uniref:Zinc finger MYM-type protein 4-like n=1 Tax=Solea senegalensis TaxID=28829 RepID=A0AAV6RBI2_SOLSE|nr:uncharacterized protein LOC122786194 isoform X2 [Solea senegalensis]KAG7501391.1 zinc finger MYM-type protein 4-like [Solea senegalensis]